MADDVQKEQLKVLKEISGGIGKLTGITSSGSRSSGAMKKSEDSDSSSVLKGPKGLKAITSFERELKKPTSPINKMLARLMDSIVGRAVAKVFISIRHHTQEYYQRVSGAISGLFSKLFGNIMSEIQPFVDIIKASGTYLWKMVIKPLGKLIIGLPVKLLVSGISKLWEGAKGLFKPKLKTPEQKQAAKQTDYLKLIKLYSFRIERNTRYMTKQGLSAYKKEMKGRLGMSTKRLVSKTTVGPTGAPDVGEVAGKATGILGKIWGGATSVVGWAANLVVGVFKTIGSIGGFIGGLVPIVGGILGPIMAIALPLLLGSTLFKGAWGWFKGTTAGTWVDTELVKPFMNFMRTTFIDEMKVVGETIGGVIADTILGLSGDKSGRKDRKTIEGIQSHNIEIQKSPTSSPLDKEVSQRIADEETKRLEGRAKIGEDYNKRAKKFVGIMTMYGLLGGATATKTSAGGYATGGIAWAVSKKLADYAAESALEKYDLEHPQNLGKSVSAPVIIPSKKKGGILINAHEGEYVVQKKAVDKIGIERMNTINRGMLPSFELGGDIESAKKLISNAESSGGTRWNNPSSSARGKYQFIDSTWNSEVKDMGKPWFVTPMNKDTSNDPRKNNDWNEAVMDYRMNKGMSALKAAGLKSSAENLYLYHFLPGKAIQMLRDQKTGLNKTLGEYMTGNEISGNKRYASMNVSNWLESAKTGKFGGGLPSPSIAGIPSTLTKGSEMWDSIKGLFGGLWDLTSTIGKEMWETVSNMTPDELSKGIDNLSKPSVAAAETDGATQLSALATVMDKSIEPTQTTSPSIAMINSGGESSASLGASLSDNAFGLNKKYTILALNASTSYG